MALPSFPVVFVTVANNIMVAGAFHFYSFSPPSVMVGIKPEKFTCDLINEKMEFGINIPRIEQLNEIKLCGSLSGRNNNKYEKAGFTGRKGNKIDSHLIDECPVNIECKVVHKVDYPGSHCWYIGEIVEVHIDEDYTRDDALMFWLGQFRTVGQILEGNSNDNMFK